MQVFVNQVRTRHEKQMKRREMRLAATKRFVAHCDLNINLPLL